MKQLERFHLHLEQIILLGTMVCVALPGCMTRRAHPVDAARARQTLQNVLESWQRGDSPSQWRKLSPAVVIQDVDWQAGRLLESFTLVGNGTARDANLYCQVKLTFADESTGPQEKMVMYVVGTDPVLTVFRDMMQ